MSTSTTTDPSVEDVEGYDTETLITYLKNQQILNLNEHINVLRGNEVAGYDFLSSKQEDLERYGLKPGSAKKISDFAIQLNSQKLTEQELLRTVLPVPRMHPIKTKSTTNTATRKIPNKPVLAWDDFLTNAFNVSTALDTGNHIFNRPNITGALSVEDSVVDMFLKTMEATSNQRLILLPAPERWSKRYVFRAVKGQPDAIRCSAGNIQLLNDLDASLILSVVEVKPEQLMMTLLDDETELFNAYNTALTTDDDQSTVYSRLQKIIRIVRQLFGYMVVNDLKYSLLTTYIRTWFFYRQDDNPDNIYISPAVYINQSHTGDSASFLECMYYFESISTTNSTAHSSPPNTDDVNNNDRDRDNDGGGGGRDRDRSDDEFRPPTSSSKKSSIISKTFGVITRSKSKKRKRKTK